MNITLLKIFFKKHVTLFVVRRIKNRKTEITIGVLKG